MTEEQEFDIMKLVLDKFLWISFIIMGWGVYQMLSQTIMDGIWFLITGIILLGLFVVMIVKEYEIIR